MLAPTITMNDVWSAAAAEPPFPPIFPFWDAFHAEPNREQRSADLLIDQAKKLVYWPHYSVKVRRGRAAHTHGHRERSVLPGVLFAPVGQIDGFLEDWARLRPMNLGRHLTSDEIWILKEIEGKLQARFNRMLASEAHFEVGDQVRFRNDLFADKLGNAIVTKVAKHGRIGVRIDGKLFGGKRDMVVSVAELEAM